MNARVSLISTVLALVVFPIVALAQEEAGEQTRNEFSRNALYVRGGITFGFDASSILLAEVDAGVGAGGAVGYRLHPHLGVEGQIEWQGNQSISVLYLTDVAELSRWDATGNLKLYLATGRFQPYVVAGAGYVRISGGCTNPNPASGVICEGSGSADSFVARLGGGLDVYITPHFGLYAEGAYMLATSDIEPGESFPDYGTLGAGVIVAF